MKKKILIPLLILSTGISCLGGCTQTSQKISFNNYWKENSLTAETLHERLTYAVTYDKGATSQMFDYTLEYSDGSYVTELITGTESGKEILTYKTELNITVVYALNGERSEAFHDKVVSECKFYTAENSLRPISSSKEIRSTSPAASASTLAECYQSFHYQTSILYNEDATGGTYTVTHNPDEENAQTLTENFSIKEDKYSYLDNEQLLFAARCISSATSSAKATVFSPFIQMAQSVSFSFASEAGASFTYLKNGVSETKDITYRPLSIVLDEKNPGATQTAWYAKMSDSSKNVNRNVMLRLEIPLSYGYGSLVYTLNKIERN